MAWMGFGSMIKHPGSVVMALFCGALSIDACAAHKNYEQSIRAAQTLIHDQQFQRAENQLEELNRQFPKNQEVLSMLIRLQCTRHAFGQMRQTLRSSHYGEAKAALTKPELATKELTTKELKSALQFCDQEQLFAQAQELLDAGNAADTIQAAEPMYRSGPDPYRAGLILARAYRMNHQEAEAAAIYAQLAQQYPNDAELATQAKHLQTSLALDKAQGLLDAGDTAGAIQVAQPLYPADPYRAGLILARAYRMNHQKAEAAAIYAQLAQQYPNDPELATQTVLTNLDARNFDAAKALYRQMNDAQQQKVLAGLGGAYDRLFPNSLTLEGGWANSSGNYPNDDYAGLQFKTPLLIGTIVGHATHAYRFDQSAVTYGIDYYGNLGHDYATEITASHSPSGTFLARNSISFGLSKSLGAYTIEGSIRHLVYSSSVANVIFGGFGMSLNSAWSFRNGIYYVPQTGTYTYLLAPQRIDAQGNKTYLYWTVGQSGEQLEINGTILRTPGYSLKLGHMINLSPQLAISGDVFHEHLTGLYDRQGLNVAVTQRW